jgi:hypothetical protein
MSAPRDPPNRHRVHAEGATFEVEETSGVAFAEATGRVPTSRDPAPSPSPRRPAPRPGKAGVALFAAAGALAAVAGLFWSRRPRASRDARPVDARPRLAADARQPPPREATPAALAGPVPDAIPLTGEEDPLVEVDNPEFTAIVAEFMRTERAASADEARSERPAQ